MSPKRLAIRGGLEALYFTGGHLWLRPFIGGVGLILTLHHVLRPRTDAFQPNRLLEVTPQFLEAAVRAVRRSGIEFVSLDEMHRRLTAGDFARRFACLTFDDGYRDTLQWAYPILKQQEVPFAVYIPTSFPDRLGELWWLALEAVIASTDRLGLAMDGRECRFDCSTAHGKQKAFDLIYWWLRGRETEDELRQIVRDLAARYGVDVGTLGHELCMKWPEIAELAADPLVTIGAHTVTHSMLAKLPRDAALGEMRASAEVIEAALGKSPRHFSYPVGDRTSAGPREFAMARQVGFATAVTTRPGMLFPEHRDHMTALPRVSLNGEYQQRRYLRVLLSGTATGLWNGFRKINAA